MAPDLPDYTREMTIMLRPEFKQQVLTVPWWVRYPPIRILFLDDAEGVLKWVAVDGTVDKVSDAKVYEASNAIRITTDAFTDATADAYLKVAPSTLSKIMLQLTWLGDAIDATDLKYILFRVNMYTDDAVIEAAVKYLHYDTAYRRKWQYENEDAEFVDIPGGEQTLDFAGAYHHFLRLIFDPTSAVRKYSSLVADGLEVDMSALSLYSGPATDERVIYIGAEVATNVDVAVNLYLDAICISDQEP